MGSATSESLESRILVPVSILSFMATIFSPKNFHLVHSGPLPIPESIKLYLKITICQWLQIKIIRK